MAHVADRPIDGLAAVGRQSPELFKELARLLFLVLPQVLPGFHTIEYALLLLRRQTGELLQPSSQLGLALRRQTPELGIAFECPPLLRR